jgi:UDP-N-acetyl-D-mannosaminuronate dehydrogenase
MFSSLYDRLLSGQEKLSVTGLGYVGMPIAAAFAEKVKVIGYDMNEDAKVDPGKGSIIDDETNEGDGEMTQAELIAKAQEAFNKAQEAQQNGDWAAYGKYLDQLEEYLNQLAG